MCSPSTSGERASPRRRPAPRPRGLPALFPAALLALGAAFASCDRPSPRSGEEVAGGATACPHAPPGPGEASGKRPLRVIVPRETPRSPFFLGLRAEMLDELACEIKLDVSSRDGGPAAVEFSLPEGAALSQGSAFEDSVLEAGETREYRVVVQMPPEGHHFIAAYATVGGRRGEAFVELGERASAQARGLRIRQRDEGQRVIRIGGEETRK